MALQWVSRGKDIGSVTSFMWTLLLLTSVVGTNIMALYSLTATRSVERNLASFQDMGAQYTKSSSPSEDLVKAREALSEIRQNVQTLRDQFKESQTEIKGLILSSASSGKVSNHVDLANKVSKHVDLEEDEAETDEADEANVDDSDMVQKLVEIATGKDPMHEDGTEEEEEVDSPRRHIFPEELLEYITARKLPLGRNPTTGLDEMVNPIGHACFVHIDLLKQYMNYTVNALCPDDWNIAQSLMVRGCEPLPRRRCFSLSAAMHEPYPLGDSLWKLPADDSIRWSHYTCKSIECLNKRRQLGIYEDCNDCFDLEGIERTRWLNNSGGIDISIDDVLRLKSGGIRIGLDLGGGTGSFAARMKERGVTIVTTTLNLNGPFNEYLGLRGLFPMHLTVSPRLPFFDNTLDLVHSMHILNDWLPIQALEFLLYDIDRVIRPGGLFWLDRFFCRLDQLDKTYIPMFDLLGYKRLNWAVAPKLDQKTKKEVYLSALLEKPLSRE